MSPRRPLTPAEREAIEALVASELADDPTFRTGDPLALRILTLADGIVAAGGRVTTAALIRLADLEPGRASEVRVGRVLRSEGWTSARGRVGGRRGRVYAPPASSAAPASGVVGHGDW